MPTIRMNREQMQGGYTVLPNQILRTREMSYKARYLLAQMLSMSEAWQYTVAGMAKVCGMGRDAVRTAMVELETLGYLVRSQSRANGRFSHNVYIIREEPVEVESAPAEAAEEDNCPMPATPTAPSTVQKSVSAPLADSPLPVSTLPENLPLRKNKGEKYQKKKYQDSLPSPIYPIYPQRVENVFSPRCEGLFAFDKSNNPPLLNAQGVLTPCTHSPLPCHASAKQGFFSNRHRVGERVIGIAEWNSCLSKYKRQVEYDTLLFDHPEWKERLDELLELMTEASCCPAPTQRIGGCQVSTEVVRARYAKIDMFIMDYIFDKLSTTIQPIRNIRQYLRTVLFHAPSTCTHDYDARVRWDFHGQNHEIRS